MHERLSPTRVTKIINTMKRERGGTLRHATYKDRMTGKTEQWEMTEKLFAFHAKRLGFNQQPQNVDVVTVVEPQPTQQRLF